MKKQLALGLCLATLVSSAAMTAVDAHGVWFANRLDEKALVLGEGPLDNAYSPSCVQKIDGYTTMGQVAPVTVVNHHKNVSILTPDNLGVTATYFDYGYFTKTTDGKMVHKPFNEVPNAAKTTHAIKWNINYWDASAKPMVISDMPIQIVPMVNPLTLKKGDTFEIQVLKDGKPMANAPLIKDVLNDLTNESQADANGRATVTVNANGLNVIGVEIGYPSGDAGTQNKYFSSLSFTIYPEE